MYDKDLKYPSITFDALASAPKGACLCKKMQIPYLNRFLREKYESRLSWDKRVFANIWSQMIWREEKKTPRVQWEKEWMTPLLIEPKFKRIRNSVRLGSAILDLSSLLYCLYMPHSFLLSLQKYWSLGKFPLLAFSLTATFTKKTNLGLIVLLQTVCGFFFNHQSWKGTW